MTQLGISYRAVLRPDAKPDIPISSPDAESKDGGRLTLPKRGAFEKRRKAEIIQIAFDGYERAATPEVPEEQNQPPNPEVPPEEALPKSDMPVISPTEFIPSSVKMVNKKLQVQLPPKTRTRCNQTNSKITGVQTKTYVTTATQTEMSDTVVTTPPDYPSDSDDESAESHNDDDSEYSPTDDDYSSDGDESDTEFPDYVDMNYKLNSKATPVEEKQFMVSETSLAELLSMCRYCSSECISIIKNTNNLPWGNLMTATAILCSGSNSSKVFQMFQHLNLQMMSSRTYNRLQTLYASPSATMAWDSEQTTLLVDLHNKEVIVGGDARCDSPGYSAKYGSYTMMDLQTSKILDFQLVHFMFSPIQMNW